MTIKEQIQAYQFDFKDYKFIRKYLQTLDWNILTNEEKIIVCQYAATTETNRKTILGSEFAFWSSDFDIKSIECRKVRFANAKTILIENIDLISRFTVLGTLNTMPLINNYIEQGVEGTNDNDPVSGLFDFIESTGSFIGAGLNEMELTMIGILTKSEMITVLMQCLRNGDY